MSSCTRDASLHAALTVMQCVCASVPSTHWGGCGMSSGMQMHRALFPRREQCEEATPSWRGPSEVSSRCACRMSSEHVSAMRDVKQSVNGSNDLSHRNLCERVCTCAVRVWVRCYRSNGGSAQPLVERGRLTVEPAINVYDLFHISDGSSAVREPVQW